MKSRMVALLLAGVLAASALTGCGGINQNATVATMTDTTVSLGIANFYVHFQQALYEDMYKGYFGDDVWNSDAYGSGTTMGDSMKSQVMDELHELYTLKNHMADYDISVTDQEKSAITKAAQDFLNSNSSDAISELGATQENIEEILTLYTIRSKMEKSIKAEANVSVSDAEANMRGYSQIKIAIDSHKDDAGNSVDYTEDEVTELKEKANKMADKLKNSSDATLESVAKENDYEVTDETYATYEDPDKETDTDAEGTTKTDKEILTDAMKQMKEGEVSSVIETETALYIVRVDSDNDKDATESNRKSLTTQKENAYYKEILDGWQKDDKWKVEDKQLAKISFKNSLTQKDPNASTETTEAVDTTESAE